MAFDPRAVSEIRGAVPDAVAIYLFGSQARGDARPDSDVDVAVLAAGPLSAVVLGNLQESLAALLGADVDLIDLWTASAVLRVQVLSEATVLFESDPSVRARFEATALAAYARLNEERKGILDDVRASGSVYG